MYVYAHVVGTLQTEKVEEEDDEGETTDDEDTDKDEDEDAKVEEEDEEKKSKKTVDKTVWDWVLINENKPLWTKKWVLNCLSHQHSVAATVV